MIIHGGNTTIKAPFGKVEDADGKVWMYAIAHGTLTAKTPYMIIYNEYGPITAALASGAFYVYIGVPEVAGVSGEMVKLQVGGDISSMVTASLSVSVGHALNIAAGAVADAGADFTGVATQFAVCTAASTTSTTQDAVLVPERVLTST